MRISKLVGLQSYLPEEYLRALLVFVVLVILFRIILSISGGILLKLTSKTKTDLDDILVKKSSKPLTVIALMVALRIAIEEISLGEFLVLNISRTISSVIIISLGYLIYGIIDTLIIEGWKKLSKKTSMKTDETLTSLIHGVMKFTLIVLVLLYILEIWGVQIVPLLGALGVAGLAVALALQPVLANIFSGASIILDKSVRVGDWVVLSDGSSGVIQKIGIRSTRVRSFDNELIIVPNTTLADSKIHNVSLPEPKARVVIPFGVAYGSDIEKVKKVVLGEIKKIKHSLNDPKPSVKFLEMADSSLNFKAFFYVETFEVRYGAIDEANTRIYNALNKAGIEIPFPQLDVHTKK